VDVEQGIPKVKPRPNESARPYKVGQAMFRMVRLDDDSINRILEPIRKPLSLADTFDIVPLKTDLNEIPHLLLGFRDLSSKSFKNSQLRRVNEIKKSSEGLLKQLGDMRLLRDALLFPLMDDESSTISYQTLVAVLTQLSANAKTAANYWSTERAYHGSLAIWLLGGIFAERYERHFGIKATAIRDPEPRSPYIDFVTACLAELHITKSDGGRYSAETIADALYKHPKFAAKLKAHSRATGAIYLIAISKKGET
jgi:hypothetical protein